MINASYLQKFSFVDVCMSKQFRAVFWTG